MATGPDTGPEGGPAEGVVFLPEDGRLSTLATGRAVFADAVRGTDPRLAVEIDGIRNWRESYPRPLARLITAGLHSSASAVTISADGLEALYRRFAFVRDGDTQPLADALASSTRPLGPPGTVEVRGIRAGTTPPTELVVPYHGRLLRGGSLLRQLDDWVQRGVVEPSFADAVRLVGEHPQWLDLSDRSVAILGAGAEMGPLGALTAWGATVLAVDLPRPEVWARILTAGRAGRGRVLVPVRSAVDDPDDDAELAAAAGIDVLTETPELAAWLAAAEGPLTVGNYAYADGGTHVRVSMAIDALMVHLLGLRDDVSLAFLATPTDVFAVPQDVVADSHQRYRTRGLAGPPQNLARLATFGRVFVPNYQRTYTTAEGFRYGVADCLVVQQGPNYALAKRLQRWRATVAREQGAVVSTNIAPPTRTRSVVKNKVLAAAYTGARRFGMEVFEPAASNTLGAALLVHDLRNPKAAANPATALSHPLDLFVQGANPGGLWRNPFEPRSVLSVAVLFGMVELRE